jgi:hypothetical protein
MVYLAVGIKDWGHLKLSEILRLHRSGLLTGLPKTPNVCSCKNTFMLNADFVLIPWCDYGF